MKMRIAELWRYPVKSLAGELLDSTVFRHDDGTVDRLLRVRHEVPSATRESLAIGEPRLVIIGSYEVRVAVEPLWPSASRLTISIVYELRRSGFWRIVGLVLARSYSRWCLRRMCWDTKHVFEAPATVRA